MQLEYFIVGVIAYYMTGAQCMVTEVLVEAGSEAVLPCKCSSSSPHSSAIQWVKANKGTVWRKQRSGLQYWGSSWLSKESQRVRCPHFQFEIGDYSLQIKNVSEEDGGLYICKVENSNYVTDNLVTLRVIKVSISPSVPILGNKVSVSCNVTPWPRGSTVQWTLNNNPFEPRTGIPSNDNTANNVVNETVTLKLTGTWTCVVSYKGKEGRASATLAEQGIIQPSKDNTKVYAAVGSAVSLPCVFSPGLDQTSPRWEKLKDSYLFEPALDRLPASFSQPSSSSQQPLDRSASVNEVRFEDKGKYRCSGIVEGQQLTRNMQLVVAKIDSSIPSDKKGSITLTCQLSDTSEVTRYEWVNVVYDLNGTQSVRSIHEGKTLSISKVSEENQGEWACRFYRKEEILGNVTHHFQVMSGLSGQKSSGSSQNTAAIVGLSFLLIVLLLVLAKMFMNRQRRKKILQYPALETIVHSISNEREEKQRNREKK